MGSHQKHKRPPFTNEGASRKQHAPGRNASQTREPAEGSTLPAAMRRSFIRPKQNEMTSRKQYASTRTAVPPSCVVARELQPGTKSLQAANALVGTPHPVL